MYQRWIKSRSSGLSSHLNTTNGGWVDTLQEAETERHAGA